MVKGQCLSKGVFCIYLLNYHILYSNSNECSVENWVMSWLHMELGKNIVFAHFAPKGSKEPILFQTIFFNYIFKANKYCLALPRYIYFNTFGIKIRNIIILIRISRECYKTLNNYLIIQTVALGWSMWCIFYYNFCHFDDFFEGQELFGDVSDKSSIRNILVPNENRLLDIRLSVERIKLRTWNYWFKSHNSNHKSKRNL